MPTVHLDPLPRGATAGEVLRFVCDTAGLDGSLVGRISLQARGATVELPVGQAVTAVGRLDGAAFRDHRVRARLDSPPDTGPHAAHLSRLARLLDLEADEERRRLAAEATAARDREVPGDPSGTSLRPLTASREDVGLGGRLLVTFARPGAAEPLPPNRLGPGAPVLLTQTGVQRPVTLRGVVLERAERHVTVAFDEPDDDLPADATWRLDLTADEITRRRQAGALYRAAAAAGDRLADLREVLLGGREPEFHPLAPTGGEPSSLNASQLAAVAFALSARDVACIHGPPGTGKTTAVVELIRLTVARGEMVLAAAPSNAAVDLLLDKLLAAGLAPVRLGHPARVDEALRGRALDALVEAHPDARQARKFARDGYALLRQADRWTRSKPQPGERRALREEGRALLADARRLERAAVDRVLDAARVVCGTLAGLDSEALGRRRFDRAVIDEACQATEPASWVPLLRCDRVVFAGDPCQLPPTVLSKPAAAGGLGVSLMERVMAQHGERAARLLTVQYRMHEAIMGFPNAEFYGGRLAAAGAVAASRLCDLPGVSAVPATTTPVRFTDTAGAGYEEEEDDTGSRLNRQEAALAVNRVREWLRAGVAAADLAVITPYAAQVRLVRERLAGTGVEVDSVDGFQGREKEAVVISLVRSNPAGEIGFLADVRRTNVALTRARRAVAVIGDSATLSAHPFYQRLLGHFEAVGGYGSVWEEAD